MQRNFNITFSYSNALGLVSSQRRYECRFYAKNLESSQAPIIWFLDLDKMNIPATRSRDAVADSQACTILDCANIGNFTSLQSIKSYLCMLSATKPYSIKVNFSNIDETFYCNTLSVFEIRELISDFLDMFISENTLKLSNSEDVIKDIIFEVKREIDNGMIVVPRN